MVDWIEYWNGYQGTELTIISFSLVTEESKTDSEKYKVCRDKCWFLKPNYSS